uniref:Uncharacterized protein n=1 Tax=Anguilla anguilla TaxID=7936 RepID=A0A0E9PVD6_ANGAN
MELDRCPLPWTPSPPLLSSQKYRIN